MSKLNLIVPRVGEFTKVTTSIRPDEWAYVYEVNKTQIKVKWKDGGIGFYNIDNNTFTRMNVWWGDEMDTKDIPRMIEELEKLDEQIDWNNPGDGSLPETNRPKVNVREFIDINYRSVRYDEEFSNE